MSRSGQKFGPAQYRCRYWPDCLPTPIDQLCSIGAKSSSIPPLCYSLYINLLLYAYDLQVGCAGFTIKQIISVSLEFCYAQESQPLLDPLFSVQKKFELLFVKKVVLSEKLPRVVGRFRFLFLKGL